MDPAERHKRATEIADELNQKIKEIEDLRSIVLGKDDEILSLEKRVRDLEEALGDKISEIEDLRSQFIS